MKTQFSIEIDAPNAGWVSIKLHAAESEIDVVASYTPRDCLAELADVAALLLSGHTGERRVCLNEEPRQTEIIFTRHDGDACTLRVVRWQDHRRMSGNEAVLLEWSGPARQCGRVIATALREVVAGLGLDEYRTAWHHEPPKIP